MGARRRDRAGVRQHQRQTSQRAPLARLDRLAPRWALEVRLDLGFIVIGQLRATSCDPAQKPPATQASSVFDNTQRVDLHELSVGPTLQV